MQADSFSFLLVSGYLAITLRKGYTQRSEETIFEFLQVKVFVNQFRDGASIGSGFEDFFGDRRSAVAGMAVELG